MSGNVSGNAIAAPVKVLSPKQERRRQFVKAFFSRKPVIVGYDFTCHICPGVFAL